MARSILFGLGQGLHGDQTTTGAVCFSSLPNMAQDGRGVLRLGDKTTRCPRCGEVGTIAEGLDAFKWMGQPTAVDGARIQCGCPAGSNRLIAKDGMPTGVAEPATGAAASSSPAQPQPYSQPAAATRAAPPVPAARSSTPTEDNELAEPGFYIVPKSIGRRSLEAELFGGGLLPR